MNILTSIILGILGIVGIIFLLHKLAYVVGKARLKLVEGTQKAVSKHFIDYNNEYTIVDETPREIGVANRVFLLRPLKYAQFAQLMSLFSNVFAKLGKIDLQRLEDINESLIMEFEDDIFEAITIIINYDLSDSSKINSSWLKKEVSINQLILFVKVIIMQNDFSSVLKNIDRFALKKNEQ